MHDMKHGMAAIMGNVWAMRPGAFDSLCRVMQSFAGVKLAENAPDRGLVWAAGGKPRQQKSVAILGLYGMIDHRSSFMMDLFGGTSTTGFAAALDSVVADPQVKGIVIDVDSPGGTAAGVKELSQRIYDARDKKPIVAVANMEMASAAYWIGSSAHKVFVSPSAGIGSIGVWSAAAEYSKQLEADGVTVQVWRATGSPAKAPFLPYQQFSQEAVSDEQVEVDRIYNEFRSAVARNRGVSAAKVQADFGQGKMFGPEAAVASGIADRVADLETVARRMDAGKLTLGAMESLEAAFSGPEMPDESWKEFNATERLRSSLRRKGVLS